MGVPSAESAAVAVSITFRPLTTLRLEVASVSVLVRGEEGATNAAGFEYGVTMPSWVTWRVTSAVPCAVAGHTQVVRAAAGTVNMQSVRVEDHTTVGSALGTLARTVQGGHHHPAR